MFNVFIVKLYNSFVSGPDISNIENKYIFREE
jgi:hypothetical protein